MPEISDPASRLLQEELPALVEAMRAADFALEELRDGRRQWPSPPSMPPAAVTEPNRYFDRQPSRTPAPAPVLTARRSLAPVSAAWSDLRDALDAHARRATRAVVPSCQKLVAHRGLETEVRKLLDAATREHLDIAELVVAVRREALLVPPVRKELLAVCAAFEQHRKTEESELFPHALGDDMSLETHRRHLSVTGDDVTRRLRDTLPPAPARKEASQGGLSRLLGLFKGR